jgi:phosphoribosylformylglycinamidine (FGAM) synthase-like enzyme
VNLASHGLPAAFVLFGEDASRIVLSCDPASVARIQQVAGKHGVGAKVLGETIPEHLEISLDNKIVVSAEVSSLNEAYEDALESILRTDPELVNAD